jgi:hypothetical protein
MNKTIEVLAQESYDQLLETNGFTSNFFISEAEAKTEALYNALRDSIPEELHTLLASLDAAYGERQTYWHEHMYTEGYRAGASV